MNYYEILADLIPWKECYNNHCKSTANYNGYHIHKHDIIQPITYQLWDMKHNTIYSAFRDLPKLLEDIDKGLYENPG